MPHFIFTPVGSHGDVHPFVALGMALVRRGHRVTLITAEPFRDVAGRCGLEFEPTISADEYDQLTHTPNLWHPLKGLKAVFNGPLLEKYLPILFHRIESLYVPGETVVAGGTLAFGSRIACEKLRIPHATIHLQPISCHSSTDRCIAPTGVDLRWLPAPLMRAGYYVADRWIISPLVAPAINKFRRSIGLRAVHNIVTQWSPSPQRVIGLFPEWFSNPKDIGPQFQQAGFLLFDDAQGREVPQALQQFLDEGDAPVVFSFCSAMRSGGPYFEAAAEACRQLGVRGVLLAKSGDQVPTTLPPDVVHADYAPFSDVFPRASVIVHHGGIGTSAQAMRAGARQLVMPMAFDQPDNASRMARLGIARVLYPKRFKAPAVAKVLSSLLDDDNFVNNAREIQKHFANNGSEATACKLLEDLIGSEGELLGS